MPRWLKRRQYATCPRCAFRFSLHKKREKADVLAGRWKLSWQKAGRLRVGYLGFRGWLGTWENVIGAGVGIVPPYEIIGSCMMEIRGVLRRNGLYCKDVETGRYRRAGKGDVVARTDEGKRRLAEAGWPSAERPGDLPGSGR